jgi:hypothetical protein
VIGTFENIGFEDGDVVEMVVTELDDKGLFAHAVLRISDGLLWMPFAVSKGRLGIAKYLFNLVFGVQLAGMLFFMCMQFFMGIFYTQLELILFMGPIMILISVILALGVYISSKHDGIYAESIFRVLGFRAPWRVNIAPYSEARLGTGASYYVYDLEKALKAYHSPIDYGVHWFRS